MRDSAECVLTTLNKPDTKAHRLQLKRLFQKRLNVFFASIAICGRYASLKEPRNLHPAPRSFQYFFFNRLGPSWLLSAAGRRGCNLGMICVGSTCCRPTAASSEGDVTWFAVTVLMSSRPGCSIASCGFLFPSLCLLGYLLHPERSDTDHRFRSCSRSCWTNVSMASHANELQRTYSKNWQNQKSSLLSTETTSWPPTSTDCTRPSILPTVSYALPPPNPWRSHKLLSSDKHWLL